MDREKALSLIISEPYPEKLWQLRSDLLGMGIDMEHPSLGVLDHFFLFINELAAAATAREYSHFASILDMAAVAGVALQNLLDEGDSDDWLKRFLLGAVSEGLMVVAARQYVKAWDEEMKAHFNSAAWILNDLFWRVSLTHQPDLDPLDRRTLVDQLIKPILSDELNSSSRAALIVRYYQLLLMAWIVPWINQISGTK